MDSLTPNPKSLSYEGKRRLRLVQKCIEILGLCRSDEEEVRNDPRCRGEECRWLNDDRKKGCNDKRALEFDHIFGGGSDERRKGLHGNPLYNEIKRHPWRFQLLCANCHAIKSKSEKRGRRRYEKPATPEHELHERQLKEERELLEAEWTFLASKNGKKTK